MKALSILQPWASLVVLGHKKIETRSWKTPYRGPLLIHASVGKNLVGEDLANNNATELLPSVVIRKSIRGGFQVSKSHYRGLPFGSIIGMVHVESCVEFRENNADGWSMGEGRWPLTEQERLFGDYSAGRYGWLLSKPIVFKNPIPCKGALSLWTPNDDIMDVVAVQLKYSSKK